MERAGHYYFELDDGQIFFRFYVDAAGFVQMALEHGADTPPAALPTLTTFSNDARRGILSPTVLASLTGMTEVRISSSEPSKLDVRTSDPGIIQRVLTNRTFKSDPVDNGIIRTQHLPARRGLTTYTLDVSALPSCTYYLTLRSGAGAARQ
ncbi:hypothetical protein [Neolewinella sp.]|uniref:hypothetical protein n=1 Tax=Neolewinella sp. TaxID=2993543 RepID=UPI003B52FD15